MPDDYIRAYYSDDDNNAGEYNRNGASCFGDIISSVFSLLVLVIIIASVGYSCSPK